MKNLLTVKNNFDKYQHGAVRYCTSHDSSYLAMDMGLGKTICALTTAVIWQNRCDCHAVLYVAPINICLTVVEAECQAWSHTKHLKCIFLNGKNKDELLTERADIYLINPEGLRWLHGELHRRIRLKRPKFPFSGLIVDEGTKFKGRGVGWRKLKGLMPIFTKRMVMSGRPAPNHLMDLWAQIYLLDGGKRLGKGFTTFRKTHFESDYLGYTWSIRDGHEETIHRLVSDITYTVDPALADLPDIRVKDLHCELTPAWLTKYKQFQKKKVLELSTGNIRVKNAMSLSMKLRQFCQGLIYDKDNVQPLHEVKFDVLKYLIETSVGKPMLVVYNFNHERDFLLERLPGSRYIGGGLSKQERIDTIDDWNLGKIQVLLVHPKSVSHGLNMQFGGHRLVFYSPTWSADEYHQIIARLRRKGQTKGYVLVFRIMIESTIDHIMYSSVELKTEVHTTLIKSLLEYARE